MGKGATPNLPPDISLSLEAEEMIAAWNGGNRKYDDGDTPAKSPADGDHIQQGQRTGEMDAGDRIQVRGWH